jgi:hypothetical protein
LSKRDRVMPPRGALVCLLVLVAAASPALSREAGVRLVSSLSRSISFEVDVPEARIVPVEGGLVRVVIDGYGTFSPPGAIELPGRAFRVAVPPGGEPTVSATVLEEEGLGALNLARVAAERLVEGEDGIAVSERYYPEDPWRGGGGFPIVEAHGASFMGRQRVLAVRVNPLVLDGRGARLARRILVTVSIPGAAAPSGASQAPGPPVSGPWQRLYDDLLVNPGDASRFTKPLEPVRAVMAPMEAGKKLKIRIPDTGLYAVRADSLIAAGLSAGLSTGEIALKKYYYDATKPDLVRTVDVPLLIAEAPGGAPGILDGGDTIIFYGLGIKDDAAAGDADALYTNDNVFWLEEESAGALMGQSPSPPPSASSTLDEFVATMKYRTDVWYMKNAVPGTFDFYFAKPPDVKESSVVFIVHHPLPDGAFSLSLRLQGDDALHGTHSISFSLRNAGGTHPIGSGSFLGKEAKTFSFAGLPSAWLVDGQNELVFVCDTDYKYLVNDFTIDYSALFASHDNRLEFVVNAIGAPAAVNITGFTANGGWLIDITNPWSPAYRALSAQDFTAAGGTYTLSIKFSPSASARRFIAVATSAPTPVSVRSITVDTPSHLRETSGSFQALVISHRDFIQRMGDYAAWRRGQGYRLLTADVQDVYDEFNGGLPNAAAIKQSITYGFDHWGVEFVLLVGDGSEDHKRLYYGPDPTAQGSPPDYVPPFTYSTDVSGTIDDEVIYSDKWYEFLDENVPVGLGAGGSGMLQGDGYPDVFVGRLPVGSDAELRAVLNKMTRMEAPQADDAWRRRIVLFADDRWSGSGSGYQYNSYERTFEDSTEACAGAIEAALPGGFDIRRLYLRQYTDPIHPTTSESGPAVLSKATTETRRSFTPALNRALNQGCFWYVFQGHANRTLLTTESAWALGWHMDVDSLRSYTPFIFVGFGCHISDFAIMSEYSRTSETGPHGDCMSEQLLFKPGAGAVAAYASVGFEYLTTNAELSSRFHRSFFQSPPADSVAPGNEYTGAHWILGEAITAAEIGQIDAGDIDMVLRYQILGDPMLTIDPGPPLMKFQADWGTGWESIDSDTLRARHGSNLVTLRLNASDIVAIGKITLQVNGEDRTDSLVVVPLVDQDKTYARSYRADYRYTIDPKDESITFKVSAPDGRETGSIDLRIATRIRLFFKDRGYEIGPGVDSPPSGTFILTADFPSYLRQQPTLSIDGSLQEDVRFGVPDPGDSLHWEATFQRSLSSGLHVFTVRVGDFSRDFTFNVTGSGLAVSAFSFPNPFSSSTNIVYSLNLAAQEVSIDVYTVSGLLIRRLPIPSDGLGPASLARPHSVLWDGRDDAGDRVANGTYIYVIRVRRSGDTVDIKGKSVKLE